MYHYRKTIKEYRRQNASDKHLSDCTFCVKGNTADPVDENDTMRVIPNRVSYDLFEGRRVEDHLMIIPKRHIETLVDFTDQEMLDQMRLIGKYEATGYNIYARGSGSVSRSVRHQHTHLIKTENTRKPRLVVYAARPHLLIKL